MPSVRIYSGSKLSHSSPGVRLFLGMIPLWLLGNNPLLQKYLMEIDFHIFLLK